MTTLRRRLVTVPAVTIGLVVLCASLVVTVPLAALVDLVLGRRFATVRLLLFAVCYLAWEVVAVVAAAALWIATGCGVALRSRASQRAHHRLQARWVASLLGLARRLLGLRLEITGTDVLRDGPLVVMCRHASMIDTLVPADLLARHGFALRYVLKRELLWDPALDIIGHRVPNHFLDRSSPDAEAELAQLERLAHGARPGDAVVIFPEGTRWSPEKRRRAQERLEASDAPLAAQTAQLRHTMPPRPNGTIAVLRGAPDADVVTMAHTGLEGLAGPLDALRLLPFRHPVQVALWRTPRAEVPTDHEAQRAWLVAEWRRVDDWIASHRIVEPS